MDYDAHLAAESKRFADVLRGVRSDARVPSCPDWDAGDLAFHLTDVQWFWGRVVAGRLTIVSELEAIEGEAPTPAIEGEPDLAASINQFERVSADLSTALAEADDAETVWTWADEQSVGFVRRRQAHEVLIHRVDAELAAGDRTPLPADLASDGVDEALRIMFKDTTVPGGGAVVRLLISASDTGQTWLVELGEQLAVADSGPLGASADATADAIVTGAAGDLDCWIWGRAPMGEVTRTGDPAALALIGAVLARGIQ